MNEALLQFIWQYSLYNTANLFTVNGEPITVIFPGKLNKDAGPDFSEARIKIGDTTLVGNVELHIHSSDWLLHGHQDDKAYSNLILHVVYKNDKPDVAANTPVLELRSHIPAHVLNQYESLLGAKEKLPCAGQHNTIRSITKESWLNRMLAERWEQKLADWNVMLQQSAEDWRNLLYWRMAANFGFKINAAPFLLLARSIPLNVLARHREDLFQIEAILFGQSGMLNGEFTDEYPNQLKQEYEYLCKKYKLEPIAPHLWKFLRLRPANFPTIRIAQFAALVHKSLHLFSQIIELENVKEIIPLLDVTATGYWKDHFRFDELAPPSSKHLGTASIQNIIINTIAPIQFLYASKQGTATGKDKALQLLDSVPAEKNNILTLWQEHDWKAQNASQSQALIQLYNNYCSSKRCLNCAIGLGILRSSPIEG